MIRKHRYIWLCVPAVLIVLILSSSSWRTSRKSFASIPHATVHTLPAATELDDGLFHWANLPQKYPVDSMIPIPAPSLKNLPKIQGTTFPRESRDDRQVRLARLAEVKSNFTHAWNGYKSRAWLRDEVMPLSGGAHDPFGGWAATLVDSLDTLWIMDLKDDFRAAVKASEQIDFSTCALREINVFETTIRYLGGFLAAYDLSGEQVLLTKAREIGDMLYKAFDTPNRMPITRWDFQAAKAGKLQEAGASVLVAELGSLSLEFTRLSQATGDARYFDAIQRIMNIFDEQQLQTKLPGMWPVVVNAKEKKFFERNGFTIGGMADSLYEYLPKQYALLGGSEQYRRMYENAMEPMKRNIFYRPMTANGDDILLAGQTSSDGIVDVTQLTTEPQAQHLGCFAGGMVGIGAKLFGNQDDLNIARRLVEGCLWGYEVHNNGMMPEIIHTVPCANQTLCAWDEQRWLEKVNEAYRGDEPASMKALKHNVPKGVAKIDDARYILRPEAIESVFILYRITGDPKLRERAWDMFTNIVKYTKTDVAHAALEDCTAKEPAKSDRMESFWLAETLKYFYLLFSEPTLISLDEYVLNTEAHPLRRPG